MPKDELDLAAVTNAVADIKTAFETYKETNDDRLKEAVKGTVDPLLEEKLKRIDDEMNAKQEAIDKLYAQSRRKRITVDGKEMDEAELDAKAFNWAKVASESRRGKNMPETFTYEDQKAYSAAFKSWLRDGKDGMSPDEVKALSVGSDPDGGYVVDPDTSGRVVMKVFETSPMRAYASTQVISTDALEGLHDLDEAATGWVSETGTRSETSTPQLDMWRIPVHEQYAEPRATQKLLDDAYIDMEAWLAGKVADKLSRTENEAFVSGDGVTKPRGFTTYADGTTLPGTIEQFSTGVNGDFAADPDGGDKLLDMIYGTKSQYRNNGTWFMNRVTMGGVRKLKDSNGAYIWAPSLAAGQPSTLLGYPVAGFEDMADYTTTGALAIAFADMGEAYQIVDRMGIRVLRDPYTAKPYVKFYTTKRVGGDVVNFEAIKLLSFAA